MHSPWDNLSDDALSAKAQDEMCRLLKKPGTPWTCDAQRRAALATLRQKSDVFCVLATGSGKTMVGLLPATMEPQHTTVIVLPLKSLLYDYEAKLRKMRLPFQTWYTSGDEDKPMHPSTNLVLVLLDQARKPEFRTALANMNRVKPVKRIIVDEAHYAITADDYRPSCRHLYELRTVPAQMVVLSATMPPASTATIFDAYGLQPNTTVVRTSTIRPETEYVVHAPVADGRMVDEVRKLMDAYEMQFKDEDRGLIFVSSHDEADRFSAALGLPCYRAGKQGRPYSDEQRNGALQEWLSGSPRWMVCTSAFAAGNDNLGARICINVGLPFDFMDLIQMWGRIGRDHRHAVAHLIPKPYAMMPSTAAHEHKGALALWNMVNGLSANRCVRLQISLWTDGVGVSCAANSAILRCSRCATGELRTGKPRTLQWGIHRYENTDLINVRDAPSVAGRTRPRSFDDSSDLSKTMERDRLLKDTAYIDELKSALDRYATACTFCATFEGRPGSETSHRKNSQEITYCNTLYKQGQSFDVYKEFRSFHYDHSQYSNHINLCFRCHVPQLRKDLHAQNAAQQSTDCSYKDVIGPAIFACWASLELRKKAMKEFGQNWTNIAEYKLWLKRGPNGRHVTNAIAVFLWWATELKNGRESSR